MTNARRRLGDRWLLFLCICLLGYALAGRGFAYVGLSPLFIGEVCLAMGLLAFLLTRGSLRAMRLPPAVAAVPLVLLGIFGLMSGLPKYKIDAARDAVIWGYALFGLIVAALIINRPQRLAMLMERYRRFTQIFLIGIPIMFLIYRFARAGLPSWPGVNTPVIQIKEGDVLVHLSGILAFWMADPKRNVRWVWAILLTLNMAMMGVIDRAGVVAFGSVMIICMIAKPFHGTAWRTITMMLIGVVLLWASAINIEVPGGKGRTISWEQFVTNFLSMVTHTHNDGLDSNKEWRLDWWKEILNYTVRGKYFWTGKGFGVNLADDDGFQVNADGGLRSPHNIHMTFLARMGVPGAAAWMLMHAVWLWCVGRSYLRARKRKQDNWAGLFLFLFAYYAAFMINGSFDVFIEGPMGGIWFWTIFGTGVGGLWAYKNCPHVLEDAQANQPKQPPNQHQQGPGESSRRAQLLPAAGRRRPSLPLGTGVAGTVRP
jgi:hypothetical protein